MQMSKTACKVALQIVVCLSIVIPVIAMLSGCTLIIDSTNVNTEVVPAVSAIELAL